MVTGTISHEDVWSAFLADKSFQRLVGWNKMQPVYEPYVKALPEILDKELLDSKVSVQTIVKAKKLFIEYLIKQGFAQEIAEVLHFQYLWLQSNFQGMIESFEPWMELDDDALLRDYGLTPAVVFDQLNMGISPQLMTQIRQGMTMRELLVTQPSVIVITSFK